MSAELEPTTRETRVLVLGASGATGSRLVVQLAELGCRVRAVVRSRARLPEDLKRRDFEWMERSVADLSLDEMGELLAGCDAVACCLGHRLTLKGVLGPPWRLVRNALKKVVDASRRASRDTTLRIVLMNTTGVRSQDLKEETSLAQRFVIGLLHLFLPPHADNEAAADLLRRKVGQTGEGVEWVVVRPDGLIDSETVTPYRVHPSPTRSAIFDAGKTSRINVAHFMASLISDEGLWEEWKGRMPVIYDEAGTPAESED